MKYKENGPKFSRKEDEVVVSTVSGHGQVSRDLSQKPSNEATISSSTIQRGSWFGETLSPNAVKTTLTTMAVASSVLALAIELGWGSSQNKTSFAPENLPFGNSSLVAHTGNYASMPSAIQSSSSCVQNVAFGSLGMLITQNIWPLLSGLFSCLPQATAQAPLLSCPSTSDATFSYTSGQGPLFFASTTPVNLTLPLNPSWPPSISPSNRNFFPGESCSVNPGDCGFYFSSAPYVSALMWNPPCSNAALNNAVQSFAYTNNWSNIPTGVSLALTLILEAIDFDGNTVECFYTINLAEFSTYSPPSTTAPAPTISNPTTSTSTSTTSTTAVTDPPSTAAPTAPPQTTSTTNTTTTTTTAPPFATTANMTPIIIGGAAGVVVFGVIIGGVRYLKKERKIVLGKTALGDSIVGAGSYYVDPKTIFPLQERTTSTGSLMDP